MGQLAGKAGGILTKDLLASMRELSKETDLFRNRSETLAVVVGNLYERAVKLGLSYDQARKAIAGVGTAIGQVSEFGRFNAGGKFLGELTDPKKIAALEATVKKLSGKKNRTAEEESQLATAQKTLNVAQTAKAGGLYARQFALQHAMEKGDPRAFQAIAKQARGGEGLGFQLTLQRLLGQKGQSTEEIGGTFKLLDELSKDVTAFTRLPENLKTTLKEAAGVQAKESETDKLIGTVAALSNPLQALNAKLEEYAGKAVELMTKAVAGIVELVAHFTGGKTSNFTKADEKRADETRGARTRAIAEKMTQEERAKAVKARAARAKEQKEVEEKGDLSLPRKPRADALPPGEAGGKVAQVTPKEPEKSGVEKAAEGASGGGGGDAGGGGGKAPRLAGQGRAKEGVLQGRAKLSQSGDLTIEVPGYLDIHSEAQNQISQGVPPRGRPT
jgi:uncharacterized protein YoxC